MRGQAANNCHPCVQVTKAISDTNLVISGATAASLALGRFVLLPVQRKFNKKAGQPTQNGIPHAEAGDRWALARRIAAFVPPAAT